MNAIESIGTAIASANSSALNCEAVLARLSSLRGRPGRRFVSRTGAAPLRRAFTRSRRESLSLFPLGVDSCASADSILIVSALTVSVVSDGDSLASRLTEDSALSARFLGDLRRTLVFVVVSGIG